jgi:putative transposase
MIDPNDCRLSISRQSELLGLSRSHHYYKPRPERREDIKEKIKLKEIFLKNPFYGYRKQVLELEREGILSSPKRVRRLMRELGLKALAPRQMTSIRRKEHPVYPYLLKGKKIRYPNQVWATDITYLGLGRGQVYLVAIMDLYSRKVLSWRISQSMEAAML